MSQKVYQSLKAVFLSSYVRVGGVVTQVKFTGGQKTPKLITGKLITSDVALQKALESSPEYGKNWVRIVPPEGAPPETEPVKPVIIESKPEPKPIIPEPVIDLDKEEAKLEEVVAPVNVSGVKNAQQARNYLMANYKGLKFNTLMSKVGISEAAKKHNVVFPDWQYNEL